MKIKWTKLVCHRMPERTFKFRGYYFPVCARCTGILIGYISFFILFFSLSLYGISLLYGELLILPMIIDGYSQLLGLRESNNSLRLITGILGGIGLTIITLFISSVIISLYI